MNVPALFLVPYPSDVGFAIDRLVTAVFTAFGDLNDGDTSRSHFSFASLASGASKALPSEFANVVVFDPKTASRSLKIEFARYLATNRIQLVVLLDVQPVSPLVRLIRNAGVRCIISYWGAPISGPASGLRLWLKRAEIMLAGTRRVNSLLFESRAMAELAIAGRGCPASMLDVVPTGTDPERFCPTAEKGYVQQQFRGATGRLVIVFTGHVHERKGIAALVDAAVLLVRERRRDDLFFLICGDRGNESDPYVRRLQGTGAESNVLFAGYRSDVTTILNNSDIGVVPSTGWDSFAMSALEMAAAGLPVVVSRIGGLPETIVDGETGLLSTTGDAADLADKIQFLADHPIERHEFGIRGRERIERQFTLAHQARALRGVFEQRIRAT